MRATSLGSTIQKHEEGAGDGSYTMVVFHVVAGDQKGGGGWWSSRQIQGKKRRKVQPRGAVDGWRLLADEGEKRW